MPPVPKPKRARKKHFFREWREKNQMTQEQAIGRLGWSQSKLSRLESGKIPYNQDDLEAAAIAYGCDPSDLITVNPLKEGEVVDLVRLINESKNRDLAIRLLKQVAESG
jgi:transcriptional regulator with XRE-family HTH domain